MAFGSVAASKVKIILQAEDNVTPILQQIKKNIKKADTELKTSMANGIRRTLHPKRLRMRVAHLTQ